MPQKFEQMQSAEQKHDEDETIAQADLNFLKADAGNLMSFMPSGAQWTILIAVAAFAAFGGKIVDLIGQATSGI